MPYIANTDQDRKEMLEVIGVNKFEDLLSEIPQELILKEHLNLEAGKSEPEVLKNMKKLASLNKNTEDYVSFLGAGSYDHYIPSTIDAIISRPEFATAYTPYQAEVSQGTLQTIYEFQTMVCNLFGMDAANASMYDGATALAEAIILAASNTRKTKAILAGTINTYYHDVIDTYTDSRNIELVEAAEKDGVVPFENFEALCDKETAAIVVQTPNLYGNLENLEKLADLAHANKALFIVCVDPISLGLMKKPGQFGADIVVAEGQALGLPQAFGGPYLGLFATNKKLMRKMPGRIVGATEDAEGKRGFVLTLQTREQHIRREKATSNICSNEALCALAAGVYLTTMGEEGFAKVAENCYLRSHYLAEKISEVEGFKLKFDQPFFKEFTVETTFNVNKLLEGMKHKGIFAGVSMAHFKKENDSFIVAVTEKRTKEEMDNYIKALKEVTSKL